MRAPAFLASDKPIAIACLGLVTFFPERPLFNSPCFISCMARSTLRLLSFCFAAIDVSPKRINRLGLENPRSEFARLSAHGFIACQAPRHPCSPLPTAIWRILVHDTGTALRETFGLPKLELNEPQQP